MKYCPNCGTATKQGEAFCRKCGTKIPSPQNNFSNLQQPPSQVTDKLTIYQLLEPTKNLENYDNQSLNTNSNLPGFSQPQDNPIDNQELINSYIGKNNDKIKNGKFSFNTFFFGALYVLYRKMWLLGILWLVINAITNKFLGTIAIFITLVANIVISTKFKNYYLKHVEEEVSKIKNDNPNKSKEELMIICSKKGGTTLVPVIIGIILIASIIIISIMNTINIARKRTNEFLNENNNQTERITNSKVSFGDLLLTVPSNLIESKYSTDSYKNYRTTYDVNNSCNLTIISTNLTNYNKDIKQYLEKNIYYSAVDIYSGVTTKKINKNTWYYATVTDNSSQEFYYAIAKNNKIYRIEYKIYNDKTKKCSSAHNTIITSLRFN